MIVPVTQPTEPAEAPEFTGENAPASPASPPPPPSPRALTLSVGMLATAALIAGLAFLPVPYVVDSPGPTRDTLGEISGTPLISVHGATTYPTTGKLLLTTASVQGGPGYPVDVLRVLQGWFSSGSTVQPVETVFPAGSTQSEVDKAGQAQMISSQEYATVAALTELGYTVPATLTVVGTADGTGASGIVEKGDVITSVDGKPLTAYADLLTALSAVTPGNTVALGVTRAGAPVVLKVVTANKNGGRAQLGVLIDPSFSLPVDVSIKIDDIGGPSAGMMFALGVIDKLTPEDETGGAVVAGTGTIDIDGSVGAIGGIRQKFYGALRDGAHWFLAPKANCADVIGSVPSGLHVVKVATLHDARQAVEAIAAGRGDSLPTCTAADVS
jgi:PDZ domain-containing protein